MNSDRFTPVTKLRNNLLLTCFGHVFFAAQRAPRHDSLRGSPDELPHFGVIGIRSRIACPLLSALLVCVAIALSGCGGGKIAGVNTGNGSLQASTYSITFGSVTVGQTATQSVSLSNQSSGSVQITQINLNGQPFSVSGVGALPITVSAGSSQSLTLSFTPTTTGAATGTLTVVSNSAANGTFVINLSGTGVTSAYQVTLTWDAPASSPDPVAGYNVYRAPSGTTAFQLLNSTAIAGTSYVDAAVQNEQEYDYIVESVDAAGITSAPSNTATVTIP